LQSSFRLGDIARPNLFHGDLWSGGGVNVLVVRDLYAMTVMWYLAGIAGAAVEAFLNYALTSMFTWGRRLA